jgi:hypothetical protein
MSELYLWIFLSALVLGVLWGVYKLVKDNGALEKENKDLKEKKEIDEKSDIARSEKNATAKEIKLKHQKIYEANISGNTSK